MTPAPIPTKTQGEGGAGGIYKKPANNREHLTTAIKKKKEDLAHLLVSVIVWIHAFSDVTHNFQSGAGQWAQRLLCNLESERKKKQKKMIGPVD
jgi:hypothetical protein